MGKLFVEMRELAGGCEANAAGLFGFEVHLRTVGVQPNADGFQLSLKECPGRQTPALWTPLDLVVQAHLTSAGHSWSRRASSEPDLLCELPR